MDRKIFQEIIEIRESRSPAAVLALIVAVDGSAPREPGAKMLVRQDGTLIGTIGGGAIENAVIREALSLLESGRATIQKEFSVGRLEGKTTPTGMLCGGTMTVYMENIQPGRRMVIYGGGHIAASLSPIASRCNFNIWVVDDRPEIALRERFNCPVNVICENPVDHAGRLALQAGDCIIIITHNHKYDADVLEQLLNKADWEKPTYIGMIGSAQKVELTFHRLSSRNVPDAALNRVFSPIGLDTGGGSPDEIAVSIMAEILSVVYGRMSGDCVGAMRKRRTDLSGKTS